MTKTAGLQDVFLNRARCEGVSVTIFLTNGFKLKGIVRGFDCFTVVLVSEGRQQLIYKHAISTIVPSRALKYFDSANEEGIREECVV